MIGLLTVALPSLVKGGILLAGYIGGRLHAAKLAAKAKKGG